jgi:hypothetical protein
MVAAMTYGNRVGSLECSSHGSATCASGQGVLACRSKAEGAPGEARCREQRHIDLRGEVVEAACASIGRSVLRPQPASGTLIQVQVDGRVQIYGAQWPAKLRLAVNCEAVVTTAR